LSRFNDPYNFRFSERKITVLKSPTGSTNNQGGKGPLIEFLFALSSLPAALANMRKIKRFSAERMYLFTENLFKPDGTEKET